MTEHMAPAHPYLPTLGTGIEWTPTTVTRYEGGNAVETVPHQTANAWEFWHDLHFREAFPAVSHWWFRGSWTGRVRVSLPDATLTQGDALVGWVTFDMLDAPRRPYTVIDETPLAVLAPYPPMEEQPINFALRLGIARLIVGVIREEVEPETWMTVTSLVPRDRLDDFFPATHERAAEVFGGWRLAEGDEPMREPLREALCRLMGLEPVQVPSTTTRPL